MARLFFASFVTVGLLLGMVCGVILAVLVYTDNVNLGFAITLTIIINAVIWLISPWISDLSLRWFNKMVFLDDAEAKTRFPRVHALVHDVAGQYGFSAPRLGIIPDRNPTAFTYGLLRSNARIVVTDGIFEFLNEDEQRAVVAHELGHIVNRDFIVMTAAGTLVQILYQVYAASMRSGKSSDKKKAARPSSVSRRCSCTTSASTSSTISAARANTWPTPSPPSASKRATSLRRWSRSLTASCRWRTPTPPRACCRARGTWASSTSRTRAIPGSRQRAAGCGARSALRRRCCSTRTTPGRASSSSIRRIRSPGSASPILATSQRRRRNRSPTTT